LTQPGNRLLRADLMLLLNSSSQAQQVAETHEIREDLRDRLVAIRKD